MITEFIAKQFANENLSNVVERGEVIFATCPFCGKLEGHFNIYNHGGEYKYKCYSCGRGGNFKYLIKKVLGWNTNTDEVIEGYSSGVSMATLLKLYDKNITMAEMFFDWKEGTIALEGKSLLQKQAISYLQSRNISLTEANEFNIRVGKTGKYTNMLVIPIYYENEIVNLVARRIPPYKGRRYDGPHKGEAIKEKSDLLYNYDKAIKSDWVIIVEGIFDAISLIQEGMPAVALLGKQMSTEQLLKVIDNWNEVYIMLDSGFIKDAIKIGKNLQGLTNLVKIAIIPTDDDPSSNVQEAIKSLRTAQSIECF